jgi:glycine cleavage system regulatory protein
VLSLKKSYPQILEQFEQLLHIANQKIEDMQMQENNLESRKREIYDRSMSLKHKLSSHFDDIRQSLDAKERELL